MNIFRLAGDLTHLLAIIILLSKIWKTRSCAGISGKSQILFSVVYLTRYLDLFTTYISLYNSVMKTFFIGSSLVTIYCIYFKFKDTNETSRDSFRIEILLIPCALLGLLINYDFTPMEILWTFSIYLEAVAIVPQFFLMCKADGKTESMIIYYLFALGLYRALYMANWAYRYTETYHYDLITIYAGIVQVLLYCGFLCFYNITKTSRMGKNLEKNLFITPLPLSSEDNYLKEKETSQTKEGVYVIPIMPEA